MKTPVILVGGHAHGQLISIEVPEAVMPPDYITTVIETPPGYMEVEPHTEPVTIIENIQVYHYLRLVDPFNYYLNVPLIYVSSTLMNYEKNGLNRFELNSQMRDALVKNGVNPRVLPQVSSH